MYFYYTFLLTDVWCLQDLGSPHFFNLRGIYRIITDPLFQLTRYLQDLDSPLFSIYLIFT